MDADSFIVYIKADGIYNDIAEDVEKRFGTSHFELNRPLPKGKNKKITGLIKDELGGKIITKFVGSRAKNYSYLTMDDGSKERKAKGTKICVIKTKNKFENYKNSLEATKLENKINHLEKMKLTEIVLKKITKNS